MGIIRYSSDIYVPFGLTNKQRIDKGPWVISVPINVRSGDNFEKVLAKKCGLPSIIEITQLDRRQFFLVQPFLGCTPIIRGDF